MPTFRSDKIFDAARRAKALLKKPGDGEARDKKTDGGQTGDAAGSRRGDLERELEGKREEFSRIMKDIRAARRGGSAAEQTEQVRRGKRKRQEIFRAEISLRAAEEGAGGPATGALPDFLIIGAPKCGTTFLYHLLSKHPLVEPAACKEANFFDLLYEEGAEWYRNCFPKPRQRDGGETVTGEATPSYLSHPLVPERAAGLVPRARLIALLRDPVERTYSGHHHRVKNGRETRSFEEAAETFFDDPRHRFLSQSIYVDHLLRWSEFFDGEQMLVLKSEDLFGRPRATLGRVLEFLHLPAWEPGASELLDKRNEGKYKEDMEPATRERLEAFFGPHNQRLYEFLGTDLGW